MDAFTEAGLLFESSVIPYGTQTKYNRGSSFTVFESSVISWGETLTAQWFGNMLIP